MSRQRNLLADLLKKKRVAAGLSQRDVADKLGYDTPQFISNWERGLSHPPVKSLKKLGDLYNMDPELIFEATLNQAVQELTTDMRRKFAEATTWKQTSFPGVRVQRSIQ